MTALYVSSKVEVRIASLEKAGKAGKAIARKAGRIIEKLTSATARRRLEAAGSFTKYGERRIRNCHKYDLSCGYRLIILKRGPTVILPFLGTHDECHRWLEANNRVKTFNAGAGRTIPVADDGLRPPRAEETGREDIGAAEEDALRQLTDMELRHVFSGLVAGLK